MTTTVIASGNTFKIYCNNASSMIFLYNTLCIDSHELGDKIDKSRNGYVLWLYSGAKALYIDEITILNMALDKKAIAVRARIEDYVVATSLGRREFLGPRHVLRLERPGLPDLIGDDASDILHLDMYREASLYIPRIAQWHSAYIDVDKSYDVIFKDSNNALLTLSCHVVYAGTTLISFTSP